MKLLSVFTALVIALSALSVSACAQTQLTLSAKCAAVINADTLGVLYEKNGTTRHAMASTTKIMTALLTLEAGDLDSRFTVDSLAIRVEGTSMGLREGDIVTRRALAYGMLLPSGNDAANAAAVSVAGSIPAFAELMNRRAERIGMKDTHFVTPSGLDAQGHYTTAYDMALLTAEALKNPEFREICGKRSATVEFGRPPEPRTLYNSNKLLAMYDGCIGVKTGFTDSARRCLVSAAERGGCTIIAVTLDAPDDWNDHRKLLDCGFGQVKPYGVRIEAHSAEVVGGVSDNVSIVPEGSVTLGLTETERRSLSVRYSIPEFVYAGVEAGETLGFAEIYLDGRNVKRLPMVAYESIERVIPPEGPFGQFIRLFTGGAVSIRGL